MSEEIILCNCKICLKENENGLLVSKRTYNRHRKNQQEFLDVEDINLSYQDQNLKDIYQQENVHQQEDMHQQEDVHQQEDIIDEDSADTADTNSFKEDNEYYSDYNNEEYDDDNKEKENNEMSDVNDDNNDDDDNDDDIMQIDNESNIPNKEIIEGLNLLHLKSLYNFTESTYDDIMKALTTNNISLYKVKKYLKETTGFVPEFYDMCENSCICYTE